MVATVTTLRVLWEEAVGARLEVTDGLSVLVAACEVVTRPFEVTIEVFGVDGGALAVVDDDLTGGGGALMVATEAFAGAFEVDGWSSFGKPRGWRRTKY